MTKRALSVNWPLAATLAACTAAAMFVGLPIVAADNAEPDGPIVQIGPEDLDLEIEDVPTTSEQHNLEELETLEGPLYWIGIQGRTVQSAVLRTHLQLADDLGIVIEEVVPDSPAANAGLRQHDVLIGVNDTPLQDMGGLQAIVLNGEGQPIKLKVIRLAKEMEVEVTPQEMPEAMRRQAIRSSRNGRGPNLLDQFLGGGMPAPNLPGGVSIRLHRDADGSAKIIIQQGDQTWTLDAEDAEALKQLPDHVRPFVERMRQRPALGFGDGFGQGAFGQRFDFGDNLEGVLPDALGGFGRERAVDQERDDEILKRMEQLEQQLDALRKKIEPER